MNASSPSTDATPLVSVCIITYRHAPYVRQCIEGALAQQAPFPFEIVIGEDGSDDGTREICEELAAAHPGRIRLLRHRREDVLYVDGRPRGTRNLVATLAAARGEYVALCEGDDYWTDPEKLAVQADYLRANPDCVGCFHEAAIVDAAGGELQPELHKAHVQPVHRQAKYDRRDCLTKLLSRYATCSLFFRRAAFAQPPAWYLTRSNDFFFDLVITAQGSLGFIDRRMAAYRFHPGGIWSSQSRVSQLVESIIRFKHLLNFPEFAEHHRDELFAQIATFEQMLVAADDVAALRQKADQQAVALQRLAVERDRLIAFVSRQHALLKAHAPHLVPACLSAA